jgi:peptide-methionine (S)-S-oxide reductase
MTGFQFVRRVFAPVLFFGALACACGAVSATSVPVPPPQVDAPLAATKGQATAVVAGGCFWGVQAVFQHLRGVTRATSGYAGGTADTAHYEIVSTGLTGHAESVEVTYDPSQITYGQVLRVFFAVAHDPTELNRQGPDDGRQYRSAIFTADADQARIARAYVGQLNAAKVFGRPVVTDVSALTRFYPAEDYHQDYATLHPNDMYIRINDAPKVEHLREMFPEMFVAKPPR